MVMGMGCRDSDLGQQGPLHPSPSSLLCHKWMLSSRAPRTVPGPVDTPPLWQAPSSAGCRFLRQWGEVSPEFSPCPLTPPHPGTHLPGPLVFAPSPGALSTLGSPCPKPPAQEWVQTQALMDCRAPLPALFCHQLFCGLGQVPPPPPQLSALCVCS